MVCEHLRQLYQLCLDQKIRLGGADLIHLICHQCGRQEVCPSNLLDDRDDEPVIATKTDGERSNDI